MARDGWNGWRWAMFIVIELFIKFNQILSFHLTCLFHSWIWHIGLLKCQRHRFQTESSNYIDFHSKWLIHFVKLNFRVDSFLIKKLIISNLIFRLSFHLFEIMKRCDTNEPPHSTKSQNLINEIYARNAHLGLSSCQMSCFLFAVRVSFAHRFDEIKRMHILKTRSHC